MDQAIVVVTHRRQQQRWSAVKNSQTINRAACWRRYPWRYSLSSWTVTQIAELSILGGEIDNIRKLCRTLLFSRTRVWSMFNWRWSSILLGDRQWHSPGISRAVGPWQWDFASWSQWCERVGRTSAARSPRSSGLCILASGSVNHSWRSINSSHKALLT